MSIPADADSGALEEQLARLRALAEDARSAQTGPALADHLASFAHSLRADARLGAEPVLPARFGMIGASPAMLELFDLLEKVAPANVPVLVQGETGVGKELVARALHDYSPRRAKPFLAENCAAVPANLLESELFGHEKGAFTGAVAKRPGHFVVADGGTVFLDEIGDMPLEMQAKLLRVLQDGEVRPVGANRTIRVDVRLVAATHRDLPQAVAAGTFREDLLFRLNVITLKVPALRDRATDVPLIARYLIDKVGREMGRGASLSQAAIDRMQAWAWPGNVRELENEVRRAMALSSGEIRPEDLSPHL